MPSQQSPSSELSTRPVAHPTRFSLGGDPHTVAIVGGGLAGLAAACVLADSGFRVTLFERRPYLGGRASSYEHPATGEVVDNCQHALFGVCTNLIAFYKTLGVNGKIRWFDRMTFIEPGGRQSVLESSFLPAPFHATPSFLGFKFLSARDKIALSRGLLALITRTPQDDGNSFQDWLARHRQTPAAIERFWKPILVSALSEDLDRIAVPYAAQVVRESMKSRAARVMGLPSVPLTELYNAGRDYIAAHGATVRLRAGVQAFCANNNAVILRLQDGEEAFDYVVLAVPFDSLAKLLPDSSESEHLREKLSHFETSPITGVHLWLDRQITDLPHAVLLDRTIQWMFHKSLLLARNTGLDEAHSETAGEQFEAGINRSSGSASNSGTSNYREIGSDSAREGRHSLAQDVRPGYEKKPIESRRDGTLNASYIELVISSSKSLIEKSRQEIINLAFKEVREFFPGARDATVVKATVIKELNATFSPKPGIDQYRPGTSTPWPRVFLAGDWTATGWPATMEGAVRGGYQAAEAITLNAGSPKKFLVPDLPAGWLMRILSRL